LSLVGFPLTAGFTGRWALLGLLAQIHPTAALLLLLGTVSVAFVCARGIVALLAPAEEQQREAPPAVSGRVSAAVYGVGFAVVAVLGIFPQWLLPAVAATASGLIQLNH
jgi:NADH:ubiquinone oxidoreductase subunit 2 (subunit N)